MRNVLKYIAILLFFSTSVFAQDFDLPNKKTFAGIQGSVVYSDIEGVASNNAQALANASGSSVTYTYENSTLSGRIFAGYRIAPKFSIEMGYFNSLAFEATYKGTASGTAWSYTQSAEAAGIDFAGRFDIGETFYAKAGLHSSRIDELRSFTASSFTYTGSVSASGTGFLIGFGTQKDITPNKTFWNSEIVYYDSVAGVSDTVLTFFSIGVGMYF